MDTNPVTPTAPQRLTADEDAAIRTAAVEYLIHVRGLDRGFATEIIGATLSRAIEAILAVGRTQA